MYNKIIRNRIFIAILCLVLAGVISFKVVPAQISDERNFEKAIVASKNIETGDNLILGENIEVQYFRPDNIPVNCIQEEHLQKNLYANNYISKKEFVLTTKVSDQTYKTLNTNKENVIISLSFDGLAQSVANKIKKNDSISVISFNKRDNKVLYEESLTNLLVLDIVDRHGNSIEKSQSGLFDSKNIKKSEAVIISCSLDQAIELIELDKTSDMHFILSNKHE